ncbi:TonB-dependent receptor [Paracoccus sp. S1E-3]|uniref:TonB-dependent receptor plug domain-containing protein n=1 Tax=Paracoccus sp. S1E-3 TaxID=2756130 RepID=UPI0015EE4941|nr:TonB-dependent receptor [Paracoccus sp. S1E-3]MBA4490652.1 TonB-dependent receptor [Paracoccus sp. S1E-3]
MRTLLLLSATLLPAAALAQDAPILLDPITLYGGLTPIEAQAYGRASTVLTAQDFERRGVTTVEQALRQVPGVAISASGESNAQIRIRGAEGNHTLVLIDGIRAAAGDQEYFLSGLELANVDRIEVLRGPQSVFFGADASAGVVNIITRKGGVGTEASGTIEIGDGWAASAHVSTRGERGGISLNASKRDDDGYDISQIDGGDDDGLTRETLQLSGDYALTEDIRAGATLRRATEEYDYDATNFAATSARDYLIDSRDHADRTEKTGQVWLEADMLDGRLSNRLSYDQTRYDFDDHQWTKAEARTDLWKFRSVYGIDGRVAEATQTIAFGLEHSKDENSLATEQRRRSNSAVLEYRGAFANGLDVQFGLRQDNNDVFDDATTWSLGLSYQMPNAPLRLHASAGTGVVNPDYIELFGGFGYVGNPNLKPEENRGFDLGVEATLLDGRAVVDLTYFHEDLEDEITFSGTPLPDGTNYYNQDGTSKRRGVEIAASLRATDSLSFGANYTYLHAKNPDGSVETRRPRHQLGLNAAWLFAEGRGSLSGDVIHVAGNYDQQFFGSFATEELPDYTVVNVAAGYDLTDKVRLTGRVVNLFDEDYSDVWGYPARGRTAYLGLAAKW